MSELEASDLVAIAKAIPVEWCVHLIPPHGQVAIEPLATRHRYHRGWVASQRLGRICRDVGHL